MWLHRASAITKRAGAMGHPSGTGGQAIWSGNALILKLRGKYQIIAIRKVLIMSKIFSVILTLILGVGISFPSMAGEFSFTFDWGDISSCDDGHTYPGKSPIFTLSNVPEGTKQITFAMEDLDINYDHKGGVVKYTGKNIIPFGAFEYLVPCPPNGSHVYEWTAFAKNTNGDTLAKATSKRKYPK